jgi:hypothetical protein
MNLLGEHGRDISLEKHDISGEIRPSRQGWIATNATFVASISSAIRAGRFEIQVKLTLSMLALEQDGRCDHRTR